MKQNLVVGAGFSGATIARLVAENLKEKVLVIDKKDHIAGNCFDYPDKNAIMIHKYGSHIFHTNNEIAWNFITRFTDFNNYEHKVLGMIDGIETHIPFNINTLYDVFPDKKAKRLEEKLISLYGSEVKIPILEFLKQDDEDLKELANYVYEKIFLYYTTKQWGVAPSSVDGAVTARVPVYISRDNRYFQDKYQGIPIKGYTEAIKKMLNHPNIEIKLNTDYKNLTENYNRVFYTGAIDEFFNYELGQLPYRSVYFEFEEHDKEFYQNNSVVNYPCSENYTRIHEYKYYLNDKSKNTVIAKEYSESFELGKNERYYPIPKDENKELYEKYLEKARALKNVYFLGRLGDYKYYDMDKAIARAIEVFESLNKEGD